MELGMAPENDEEWESIVEAYDRYYYAEKVMDRLRDDISQDKLNKDIGTTCYVA